MEFKNTGASETTITRDLNEFVDKTGNIYQAVSILAKRSSQINQKMKEELLAKLDEFALNHDQLDEVFENAEQIAVSRFYEKLPKPWSIAIQEMLEDKIYTREDTKDDDSTPEIKDA
ncbi:MAG: DNA-directed RNA polymerase subunit omega [Bacteroidota bacterium]|nr:DNA-directed RNA polymerase subunit omega [Bacteroidota bacterium]